MLIIHMSYHYELESYLISTGLPSVAGVSPSQVVAGVRQSQDMMMDMLTKLWNAWTDWNQTQPCPLHIVEISNVRLHLHRGEKILFQRSLWFVTSVERRATLREGVQFAVLSCWEIRNPRRKGPRVRGQSRGPTHFQITYALVEISFQNTKSVFKTNISFQNTNQFSKYKSSSQNTNHRSNTQNQLSNRKYNQLQTSKTSFSIGYEYSP